MWKDIKGYENLYQIDEYGNVKSLERISVGEKLTRHTPERMLRPHDAGKGYLTVWLRKDNISCHKYIHQLVAENFVTNADPNENKVVNHKDGDKHNNHYTNLEWVSYSQNNQHAYNTGLKGRGESFYSAKLTEEDVRQILREGKYTTYQNIADKYNVTKATIRDVLIRKTWKHIEVE